MSKKIKEYKQKMADWKAKIKSYSEVNSGSELSMKVEFYDKQGTDSYFKNFPFYDGDDTSVKNRIKEEIKRIKRVEQLKTDLDDDIDVEISDD